MEKKNVDRYIAKDDRLRDAARKRRTANRVVSETARVRFSEADRRTAGRGKMGTVSDFSSEEKLRRSKGKKSVHIVNIVCFCFFCLFLAYIAFYFYKVMTTEKSPTVQVVYGSVDIPVVNNGVIIREETVYRAGKSGVTSYRANNFDKVRKDSVVCEIYDEKTVKDIESKLMTVNKSIMAMQETRGDYSLYESDVKSANAIIKREIDDNSSKFSTFDVKAIYIMTDKIQNTLDIRNNLLLSEDRGSLMSFAQEKNKYEDQLRDAISSVTASEGGVVSYKTDGLEDILKPSDRMGLSKEQTEMKVDYDAILYPKDVSTDDIVFKIVTSNEWYIASYIPNGVAETLREGRTSTLYVVKDEGYISLEMTVEKIVTGDMESYVVFKSTKLMSEYLNSRSISFKLNLDLTQGFKIPSSAVAERMLLKIPKNFIFQTMVHSIGYESDCVLKRGLENDILVEINTMYSDDLYCYVLQEPDGLKLGDVVVSSGDASVTEKVSDFDNVTGLYVQSGGTFVYKLITLPENVSLSMDYIIIDPKQNRNIKIDDTIISDINSVGASLIK